MVDRRRELFDQAAEYYDEARPRYPAALFDDVLAAVDAGSSPHVLEIGPGTGQATRSWIERGCSVVAVELGPRLAARLRENIAGLGPVTVIGGAFEEVELPANSFDVVTAATAIHWIDPQVRYRTPYGLLRENGVLAIIEVIQVSGTGDPDFFELSHPIYAKYRQAERDQPAAPAPAAASVAPRELAAIEASGLFGLIQVSRYPWDQTYTTERYALLLRTYSDMLAMPIEAREGLIREICELIDERFGGQVVRPLVVTLTVARKVPRPVAAFDEFV